MGKLSVFGNIAGILLILLGFAGGMSTYKPEPIPEIYLWFMQCGLFIFIICFVIGVIAIFLKRQKRWAIVGVIISGLPIISFIVYFYVHILKK